MDPGFWGDGPPEFARLWSEVLSLGLTPGSNAYFDHVQKSDWRPVDPPEWVPESPSPTPQRQEDFIFRYAEMEPLPLYAEWRDGAEALATHQTK